MTGAAGRGRRQPRDLDMMYRRSPSASRARKPAGQAGGPRPRCSVSANSRRTSRRRSTLKRRHPGNARQTVTSLRLPHLHLSIGPRGSRASRPHSRALPAIQPGSRLPRNTSEFDTFKSDCEEHTHEPKQEQPV
jgi:hypothetical protein